MVTADWRRERIIEMTLRIGSAATTMVRASAKSIWRYKWHRAAYPAKLCEWRMPRAVAASEMQAHRMRIVASRHNDEKSVREEVVASLW